MAKALGFIKTSGVSEKAVQTDVLIVEPLYDDRESRIKPTGFLVRRSIDLEYRNISGFDAFITGLLTNGVTTVQGIQFQTSELRQHRDRARAAAVRAAKEKAQALANESGVRIGKVYSISMSDYGGWLGWTPTYWSGGLGGAMPQNWSGGGSPSEVSDTTFSIGQISVWATVSVSYRIR